jgi:hypothetical protein
VFFLAIAKHVKIINVFFLLCFFAGHIVDLSVYLCGFERVYILCHTVDYYVLTPITVYLDS